MAVPVYQDFLLPLLHLAADGQEHRIAEAMVYAAQALNTSQADQEERLPSGTQTRFYNRLCWALTHLEKAALIEKTGRGRFIVSPRGLEILKAPPAYIDEKYLAQFAEYREFTSRRNAAVGNQPAAPVDKAALAQQVSLTPDERLDAAYQEIRQALADDLLLRVRSGTPKFFEHLVVDLLVAMGYGGSRADAAQVVGKSGDGGIDGVIKEDRLGLDMVYVQAKRYEADVGPAAIREFVGSLGEHKAHKGVFITCGGFTAGARDAAAKAHTRIVLIDGDQLADFMIDHGVGVANVKEYTVKKLDSDYFDT